MDKAKTANWLAIAAVIAAQAGFLGWMVWDRVSLLKNGREISLKVIPVDPRDLFRGDYVILGYDVSPYVHDTTKSGKLPDGLTYGSPVFVTLSADAAKGWASTGLSLTFPKSVAPGDVVLKGMATNIDGDSKSPTRRIGLLFGIESYFVPEGEGRVIEKEVRENKVEALVAVGPDGETALKALTVGGQRIHEQPLL